MATTRKSSTELIPGRSTTIQNQRKASSTTTTTDSTPNTSPSSSPKVQLIPYSRTASFDIAFSAAERELLDQASNNFDALDLSSKDFDFEDIFTYDKPQKKLRRGVVEVSSPNRTERDWSSFSFSHYSAAVGVRNKVNKGKSGGGEGYGKNDLGVRKF